MLELSRKICLYHFDIITIILTVVIRQGYFCVMAGVSLCIDKAMIVPADWAYLLNMDLLTLAIPGLVAGLGFCLVSRYSTSDTTLPIFMVSLPLLFYVLIYITGYGVDPARDHGWLGPLSQPVSPQKVFELVKLDQVHWFVLKDCFAIWAGMVFVVSFSSCLDVAAISMDMGEALDVNNELMTVGVSNCKFCNLDPSGERFLCPSPFGPLTMCTNK